MPLSPPRLCAQVYRAKTEGDAGALSPRLKSGTPSSSQLNLSVLGRSPSPKVQLPGGPKPGTSPLSPRLTTCRPAQGPPSPAGSLPRNLAATLQDIEAKRQLALQQKGESGPGPAGAGVWEALPPLPFSRSLAFPPSLPPDPSARRRLQPSRPPRSPRSQGIYQVETWGSRRALGSPAAAAWLFAGTSAMHRRGTTSPGPQGCSASAWGQPCVSPTC